jgi:hypothetical protein
MTVTVSRVDPCTGSPIPMDATQVSLQQIKQTPTPTTVESAYVKEQTKQKDQEVFFSVLHGYFVNPLPELNQQGVFPPGYELKATHHIVTSYEEAVCPDSAVSSPFRRLDKTVEDDYSFWFPQNPSHERLREDIYLSRSVDPASNVALDETLVCFVDQQGKLVPQNERSSQTKPLDVKTLMAALRQTLIDAPDDWKQDWTGLTYGAEQVRGNRTLLYTLSPGESGARLNIVNSLQDK